jgi:hypothetical protein
MQIPPKKGKTLEFCSAYFTVNQFDGTIGNNFGVQEHKIKLRILTFNILRILPIQILTKRLKLDFCCRTNLKYSLLPICGKFTRA